MADDKLPDLPTPDEQSGDPNQKADLRLESAAGASAYVESAAESGEMNLGDLDGPPPNMTAAPHLARHETPPAGFAMPADAGPSDSDSPDFPQAALAKESASSGRAGAKADKISVVYSCLSGVFKWLRQIFRSIPPAEDVFDQILFSLGLQRKPASMLKRANSLARKGRLAEAVKWYRDLLLLRPLSIAAYDGLGRAYFRMGLGEEANREFTIADNLERILHNRDDIDAATALAQAFLDRKQAKMSVSLIEPVLVAHFYTPNNSNLLKTMGRVYAELRANKKMFQVYQAGLAQYPEDYEFHILKGNAEMKMGNSAEGEKLVRWGQLMKRLKEAPKDANARMAMGEMCLKEGKTNEGLAFLREAASLLPENAGIRWRLFNLYQKQGNYDDSLKYFLEVVELEPGNEDLQYRLAEFYRRHRHREEALAIYRALADKHPRDPKPHALLGDLLTETGSFEEGQTMKELAVTLECGLKANPDHRETVRFMKYLFSIGDYREGMAWLDRGLTKWPYHGELVLTKVRLLYNEFRYKDAVILLKRLISVKPDVAEPHIWIAMCYQRLGDNMAALAEGQLSTRLAPKSYTAHKVLGDVLKEQKKLSQANAAYEVAEMMRQGHLNK
ncbi:MAG: tetratricopeptide repeat protein [Candidatus Adiutrix sp.]|nr:tetratricopeptide repeat protein [Candidatus Adiutrix sp.]